MKLGKKIFVWILVFLFVIATVFLFTKIFEFRATSQDKAPEVTEELVNKLYSYLPKENDFGVSTMYTTYYTTNQNINYSVMSMMAYNYISNYDSFKLENISDAEFKSLKVGGTPLYKISKDNIWKVIYTIFGNEAKYSFGDFNINATTAGKFANDYYYIYKKNSDIDNNYVIFNNKLSYTITDNNKTIKIYDYYLKCDITTKLCYNDERSTISNSYFKYKDNLNVLEGKNNLKQYEHTFKYENGNYYWVSSEGK